VRLKSTHPQEIHPRSFVHPTLFLKLSQRMALFSFTIITLMSLQAHHVKAQGVSEPHWTVFRQNDGLISNEVWTILSDGDAVWVGSDRGIARYNGRWLNFYNMDSIPAEGGANSGLESGDVIALAASTMDNGVWAASVDGFISYWNGEEWTSVTHISMPVYTLQPFGSEVHIGSDIGLWRMDVQSGKVEQISSQLVGLHFKYG